MLRRGTFEDILLDDEEEVPATPQRWVWFANVATSTPVPRSMEQPREKTQSSRVSQVFQLMKAYSKTQSHEETYSRKALATVCRWQPPNLRSYESQRWPTLKEVIPPILAWSSNHG